jgi:molybdate transport system substrate-binding protein
MWCRFALLALLLALLLSACGGDDPTATPAAAGSDVQGQLTVFAAASLTEAFTELKAHFEAANPGTTVTFNFGGSQQLVTQLTQGARADVFASANNAQMRSAQDSGVIAGNPQLFTRNRLAIVVPRDNPGNVNEARDLANDGLKIVVAAEEVPVGRYTREALDLMAADATFGSDFRQRVEANFVSLEENVRQVVSKVALGEADAGVVYVTDVTDEVRPNVALIEIPEAFNVIAEYPIAAVQEGNQELAQVFIAYVLSPEGQAILERYGFTPLPA